MATLSIYVSEEFKRMAFQAADREGVPVSHWALKQLANAIGNTKLGAVKKKRLGRPRKETA